MEWLIHNKFDYDSKVRELVSNLDKLGIIYHRASVVPFSTDNIIFEDGETTVDILKDKKIFTYGSYTMANIAHREFKPGAYVSPNISMIELTKNYGNEMLNHDMVVGKLSELDPKVDKFFLRPVEDTKSIVGAIYILDEFNDWKNKIIELDKSKGYATVTSDSLFCIAPIKIINAEFRCFVVNSKVATASQYKRNGVPFFSGYVDDYIIDYVNEIIKLWQPDKAFVLDVALCNNKLSIIEANCINSSGLYEIDTQKLIIAVEEL